MMNLLNRSLWRRLLTAFILILYCSVIPAVAQAEYNPYIPISTGISGGECSTSGTGNNSPGSAHINSKSSQYMCTVHGKKVAPQPLSERILEFAKGFAKGLIDGLWDQLTGLWDLVIHFGSLVKFGKALAEHPTRTLELLKAALGKEGQALLDRLTPQSIHQELLCEPYSAGKFAGNTVETVVSLLVPVGGEAADGSKGIEELDRIAEIVDESSDEGKVVEHSNPCNLPGVAEAVTCDIGNGKPAALRLDDPLQAGEDIANGKPVYTDQALKVIKNKVIGDMGEGYIKAVLEKKGYEVIQLQNSSGHGVDIVGYNKEEGKLVVYEVKTTRSEERTGYNLSEYQREGGESYLDRQLKRFEGTPEEKKITEWLGQAKSTEYQKTLLRVSKEDSGRLTIQTVRTDHWN